MAETEVSNPTVLYHRRIDRTPEKDTDRSSCTSKIMKSELRRAVENVHTKLTRLQDGVDDRDKTIEDERRLRQAAEDRLHAYMVDMYQDEGEVNNELRHRLPRANKDDPLKAFPEGTEDGQEMVEEKVKAVVKDVVEAACSPDVVASRFDGLDDLEKQILQELPLTDTTMQQTMDSGVADISGTSPGHTSTPRWSTTPRNLPPSGQSSTPGQATPSHMYKPPYLSMPTASMYMQHMQPFSPYMTYQPGSVLSPPRYCSPGRRTPSPSHQYSHQSPTSGEEDALHVGDLQSGGDPQGSTGEGQTKDTPRPYPFRAPLSSPYMASYTPDPSSMRFSSMASQLSAPMDQARQITFLLSELDTEKSRNKRLVDKLADTEIELETAKLSQKTLDTERHANIDARNAADLVQEVHTAQTKRDGSMMGRIKLANQERDEVLVRLRQAEIRLDDQGYGTPERSDNEDLDDDDEGVDRLMTRLGQIDTDGNTDREYSTLLQRLDMMKRRQQEITAEEIQAILEQRDAALAKARRFEEELLRQQRQGADYNLRAKLAAVIQERDMALAQVRQLKEEIMTLRIYYSLHKSLSQDSHDQLNTFQSDDTKLGRDGTHKESNTSVAQLRAAEHESLQREADLQKLEHAHQEDKDKIAKLEKLIDILRRKLKGRENEQREEEMSEQ